MELTELANEEYCHLTTTGRRSGRPHEIEIWFGARDGVVYLLSQGGTQADWVRNLLADDQVRLRISSHTWDTTARLVVEPEEEAVARRLLAAKYQGWSPGEPFSDWAATALPVALDVEA